MSQTAPTAAADSGAPGTDLTEVAFLGGLFSTGIKIFGPFALDFLRSRLSSIPAAAADTAVAQQVADEAQAEIAGIFNTLFKDVFPVLLDVIKGVAGGQAAGGPSDESAPVASASAPQPQRYGR